MDDPSEGTGGPLRIRVRVRIRIRIRIRVRVRVRVRTGPCGHSCFGSIGWRQQSVTELPWPGSAKLALLMRFRVRVAAFGSESWPSHPQECHCGHHHNQNSNNHHNQSHNHNHHLNQHLVDVNGPNIVVTIALP